MKEKSIYSLLKDDIEKIAKKTTPKIYRALGIFGIWFGKSTTLALLEEILGECYCLNDVVEAYKNKRWTKQELRYRPRRRKLLPLLKEYSIE